MTEGREVADPIALKSLRMKNVYWSWGNERRKNRIKREKLFPYRSFEYPKKAEAHESQYNRKCLFINSRIVSKMAVDI